MGPTDLIKSSRYQSISGVKLPESLKCNFKGVINAERRVGSTHPAAVALARALVHAEDADILTLSVQANLQERKATQVKRDGTSSTVHPFCDLQAAEALMRLIFPHLRRAETPPKARCLLPPDEMLHMSSAEYSAFFYWNIGKRVIHCE